MLMKFNSDYLRSSSKNSVDSDSSVYCGVWISYEMSRVFILVRDDTRRFLMTKSLFGLDEYDLNKRHKTTNDNLVEE